MQVEKIESCGEKINLVTLLYPYDFVPEEQEPNLQTDVTTFVLPPVLHEDLRLLKEAQASDNMFEHFLLRLKAGDTTHRQKQVYTGSEMSVAYRILSQDSSDITRQIHILDFMHSHPYSEIGYPNLLSPDDIRHTNTLRISRFWMLGLKGELTMCLVNPSAPHYGRWIHAIDYERRYREGEQNDFTYEELYKDLVACVKQGGLRLFVSRDLAHFQEV